MRHTKSHTGKRRSHHSLNKAASSVCDKCGEIKLPHQVCQNCGTYKGRPVIDVLKKLTKKEKKEKEKKLKEQEEEQTQSDKSLDAGELSKN